MKPYSPDDAAKVAPLDEQDARAKEASAVEWTDAEREAVTHLSCINLGCPGPHDRRHGPNGPQVAREKAEKILAALAPFVAAREAQAAAEWKHRRDLVTLADECAARVHDRARQAAARIINREEAMTAQDAAQGSDVSQGHPRAENGSTGHTGAATGMSGVTDA